MRPDSRWGTGLADLIFGQGGNDSLYGLDGSDCLFGGAGHDKIFGGNLDDLLLGGADRDVLWGGEGNDVLSGGGDKDQLFGGPGRDTYLLNAGDGEDVLRDPDFQTIKKNGQTVVVEGKNKIIFGPGVDPASIKLHLGSLAIEYGEGDVLHVEDFNPDDAYAELSFDEIQFADGASMSYADLIGLGFDIDGTAADDSLTGTNVVDRVRGGAGNDTLRAGSGDDSLRGDDGDDVLYGDAGNDSLEGGDGNDTMVGAAGNNTLHGGAGADTYVFSLDLDGLSTIVEQPGDSSTIALQPGLDVDMLRPAQVGNDLLLTLRGTDVGYRITDYFSGTQSWQVREADGGLVAVDDLLAASSNGDSVRQAQEDFVVRMRYQWLQDQTTVANTTTDAAVNADGSVSRRDSTYNLGTFTDSFVLLSDSTLISSTSRTATVWNGVYAWGTDARLLQVDVQSNDAWIDSGFHADSFSVSAPVSLEVQWDPPQLTIATAPYEGSSYAWVWDTDTQEYVMVPAGTVTGTVVNIAGSISGTVQAVGTPQDGLPTPVDVATEVSRAAYYGNYSPGLPTLISATASIYNTVDAITLVQGGDADNEIFIEGDYATMVDAGAGNDFILPSGFWGRNTFLNGGAGDDLVFGANNFDGEGDVLLGGGGNDYLGGLMGNDTYLVFDGVAGTTVIDESTLGYSIDGWADSQSNGLYSTDTVRFAAGISLADLQFAYGTFDSARIDDGGMSSWGFGPHIYQTLDLQWAPGEGVQIVLPDYSNPQVRSDMADHSGGSWGVEYFRFADGTVLTMEEMLALADAQLSAGPNTPPTVAAPLADLTATEDSLFTFTVPAGTFADADVGDSLVLRATLADGSPLPGWVSFDPVAMMFSGTPGDADVGSHVFRVEATDSYGAQASAEFTLAVQNTNDAPVAVGTISGQSVLEDQPFSLSVDAGMFADDDVSHGDVLALEGGLADGSPLPAWLVFDAAAGTFSGTPSNDDVGTLMLRVTATDTAGAAAVADFALTVTNVNDAPVAGAALADQTLSEDALFRYTVPADAFSDVDSAHGDSLSVSAARADGSPLPAWLSFDAATATFSGTPENGDVGSLTVLITATDGAGAAAANSFVLTVANTNDAPVVTGAIPDQAAAEGQAFNYRVAAGAFGDVDAGDRLRLSASLADGSPLPAWLGFDAATGSFSGTPANGAAGRYEILVIATDASGASIADVFQIAVADSLPTVRTGTSGSDFLYGTSSYDQLLGLGGVDVLYGYGGDDVLDGGAGGDLMYGGPGNDTYVVDSSKDIVVEYSNEGVDTVRSSTGFVLGGNVENLVLTGTGSTSGVGNDLDNVMTGNAGDNILIGAGGSDILEGGAGSDVLVGDASAGSGGSDVLRGGSGNDLYGYARGFGHDAIQENDATAGNQDIVYMDAAPLEIVLADAGNSDLAVTLHGDSGSLTVDGWYDGAAHQTEVFFASDGSILLNTQVDQLIQAMAQFSATSGLTWDEAIDQRPQDVQAILSAYWQPMV